MSGFCVSDIYEDFESKAFGGGSKMLIVVASKGGNNEFKFNQTKIRLS